MKHVQTLLLALLFTFATLNGAARAEGTKADAQAMVDKAALFLKAQGRDKLLAEVNTKDGQFHKGELYVFVYDLNATILAHPVNPGLIGKNTLEVPDVAGKFYRKEIVELAKTKGSGWVDYLYKNPSNGKTEPKTAFLQKAGDLILVAGVYKPEK